MNNTKAGFIALVGAPNAGKSTFFNQVLGQKVAIVSPKAQTTRFNVRGILTRETSQYIFVDTPGIHRPRRKLDKSMVEAANNAWTEADMVLMLMDASKGITSEVERIFDKLREGKSRRRPLLIALNKIDKIQPKEKLLPLMQQIQELDLFKEIFAVSALKGQGTDDILDTLAKYLPDSPYLYDEETLTDLPNSLLAAESTREQAFMLLQDELPYAVLVETDSFEKQEDGSIKIYQNLMVQRDTQKQIVLGSNGEMIKKISSRSRQQLIDLFDTNVHLFLKVKVRKNWDENPQLIRDMGLTPQH